MKLLETYESILNFVSLASDSHGYISSNLAGKTQPCMIGDLRLVLPTREQLKSFNPNESIIFHPLMEDILKGETDVIQKIKYSLNVKLNYVIGTLVLQLLDMLASTDTHVSMTPEQLEIFKYVPEADQKSFSAFSSITIAGMKTAADRQFVNIFLKKGGTHQGVKFGRVGIVSFPFYRNINDEKQFKLRVKDRELLTKLFEFIFPNIDKLEEYNFGSSSNRAPMLEALLHTGEKIVERIHDIIRIYDPFIKDQDLLKFNLDWTEVFEDLSELDVEVKSIPAHNVAKHEMPVEIPHPQVTQPQMPTAPINPYNPPAMVQPEAPRKEGGGISFSDIKQAMPGINYQPNPMMPHIQRNVMQQQMMQQPPLPTWAVQQPPMGQPPMIPGMQFQPNPGMPPPGTPVGYAPNGMPVDAYGNIVNMPMNLNDPNRVPTWASPNPPAMSGWGAPAQAGTPYPYGWTR